MVKHIVCSLVNFCFNPKLAYQKGASRKTVKTQIKLEYSYFTTRIFFYSTVYLQTGYRKPEKIRKIGVKLMDDHTSVMF